MDINDNNETPANQSLNESGIIFKLIDSTGRARLAAEQAIASNDVNRMKAELRHQVLFSFTILVFYSVIVIFPLN